eukprot:CAMPEP_0118688430 /NCGR_PEP_ID=MMETSP0800-20121206/8918_1 /TAXON_ID=210618 ORGANISM="Striatella unipunctata, Strain CCMP2910" /NCGR_SAMPLE_ID=MMETSP0800 /ASSEMBLY_ACC=CAM_ASM_000638 /LENGTH=939 /DNA_ID=CAMNT_0006585693 /DNA_START=30 /DNA_END=2849 /DNA_ORIENTATION=+
MSKQINYYELDKLDVKAFTNLLDASVKRIQSVLTENANSSLDQLAHTVFEDGTLSEFLLLLARLPVFSTPFEELLKNNLDVLNVLKKLKFFVNIKIRETLYLLAKLSIVAVEPDAINSVDVGKYFSVDPKRPEVENLIDTKFKNAIKQNLLFPNDPEQKKRQEYINEFQRLEKIEPHAVYPTSIYRQSDGCTVATVDSQKIEAVMSTTLTTSIRISPHVLGYDNPLLAEIYRPLGRAVVVIDDKLNDPEYTNGLVEVETNRRAILRMEETSTGTFTKITIAEQLNRYFAYHGVETKVLLASGNEAAKDIENVQQILIDLKKLGAMRNEPLLIVGGGVVADIAGFACALFHRNTPYVMLSTSIVAGIDAGPSPRVCSDGQGYKNAFGAFHPPVVTLTDRTLWRTMHVGMIRHGIAEIVKMAVVENRELFELLEKVGPKYLVPTKFGTDLSTVEDLEGLDLDSFDKDCERLVGMAMESYVRAEYGNLWETHQCRPHAYGHTWSPGYELPAGMLHGHAVATCMGFGAYLSWKHCDWISEADFVRICKLINDLELALWHDVMSDKQIFHASTKKMIQKRGGNLAAPIPRGEIGECGYLNDITDDELSRYVDEYKELVTEKLGFARNGYGIEPHLHEVGLEETSTQATALVREEIAFGEQQRKSKYDHAEEKKDESGTGPQLSYNDWIKAVQTDRNSEWKYNVVSSESVDTPKPPAFPHNTLFHDTTEEYAMSQTSVSSFNIQTAAKITDEEKLFAPCMVGTLESQFLKMFTKTMKASNILDVGTFTGMSAIAFAEGSLAAGQRATVHTLEFDETTAKAAQKIFDHCEPSVGKAINLHHTDAVAWMRSCTEDPNGATFDIIFIDADKDNYTAYYELAMGGNGRRPLLAEGGVILADNSLSALVYDEDDSRRVALHQFNQTVKNDKRVEQVVLTVREGISMISRV